MLALLPDLSLQPEAFFWRTFGRIDVVFGEHPIAGVCVCIRSSKRVVLMSGWLFICMCVCGCLYVCVSVCLVVRFVSIFVSVVGWLVVWLADRVHVGLSWHFATHVHALFTLSGAALWGALRFHWNTGGFIFSPSVGTSSLPRKRTSAF